MCEESGSYRQPADPTKPEVMGNLTQCFKEYPGYFLEIDNSGVYSETFSIRLRHSAIGGTLDLDRYLDVTHYKFRLEKKPGVSDYDWENQWSTSPIPLEKEGFNCFVMSLPYKDNRYYEVKLFGDGCQHNEEHYLTFRYYCGFNNAPIWEGLRVVNNHPKYSH